jgi:hypothetical protein
VLGATYDAWRHAMGFPMKISTHRLVFWGPCADGTTPHLTVRFSAGRAASITGQDCPKEPMDTPARRADAVLYMPQDAVITPTLSYYDHDDHYNVGGASYAAPVAVYRSARLGRTLPALDFQDCSGNPLPPGTLFLILHIGNDQGWTMGIGTCM